jgi:streptogramin lyase
MKNTRRVRRRVRSGIARIVLFSALSGLGSVASTQTITEFPIPTVGAVPCGIAAGPDGNLWFTECVANQIGRVTPAGVITEFPLTTSNSWPLCIVAGPDGNLWFTESNSRRIGRITPTGVITEFVIPGYYPDPQGIAAGPDGNLWFTDMENSRIGRITPEGAFTFFPANGWPTGIVAGPDGNLWFTEDAGGRIGRITPAGEITEFARLYFGAQPMGIAAGPDGNLWFTDYYNIGRITPAGEITEFPYQTDTNPPYAIAAGPDGNLWFTTRKSIGRITTAGGIADFLLPAAHPLSLVTGPDGNLWITEAKADANSIGRLVLVDPPGAAASFFTVPPCRAFDSRETLTFLAAGSVATVPIVGQCGVPPGATAVAVNLTVTAATTAGHLRLFPDGKRPLPFDSTINYGAEQTRANDAVAPLGASGATGVYVSQASGTLDIIVDVSGYFMPDGAPPSP